MTTILDVAKQANVSKTLVSRVLNQQRGVSPETRLKILKAMEEVNYRPNGLARSLVLQRTQVIGVVLGTLCSPIYFPFIMGIETGIEEFETEKYNLCYCNGRDDLIIKQRYINFLTQGRADGVIFYNCSYEDEQVVRDLAASRFPFVIIENRVPGLETNCVLINNFDGAYKATEYLIKLGHRNIYHFTGEMTSKVSLERLNGYLKAMQDYGIPTHKGMIRNSKYWEDSGSQTMTELLEKGIVPEAIFCGSDAIAFGAMRALFKYGLSVPRDVSIIGFDDNKPFYNDMSFPPLSTMRQPFGAVGHTAAKFLLRTIHNPDIPPETVIFDTELVIRESCR